MVAQHGELRCRRQLQPKRNKIRDLSSLKAALVSCELDEVPDVLARSSIKLRGAGYTMLIKLLGMRLGLCHPAGG